MRVLLLTLTLAAASLATPRPADACGPYEWRPQVFALSVHGGDHAYVVLAQQANEAERARLAFERIPRARAAIAPMEPTTAPVTFTLVGPAGTRIVKTSARVWLDRPGAPGAPRVAMRIPLRGDYRLALLGEHRDATWQAFAASHRDAIARTGSGAAVAGARGVFVIDGVRYAALEHAGTMRAVAL